MGPHPLLTGARPSPPPPSPAPPRGLTRDALSRGGSSLPDPARAQGHHGRATAHAHAAPYLRLPATARPRPTSATPKRLRILPPERRAPDERAKLNGRVGCRRGGGWGGWEHPGRLTLRSSAPPLPLTAPGVGPHPQPARPGVGSRGESRVRPAPPPSSGYCDKHMTKTERYALRGDNFPIKGAVTLFRFFKSNC